MNQRIEKIKEHIKRNRGAYIAGAAGVILGCIVGYEASKRYGNTTTFEVDATVATITTNKVVCERGSKSNNTFQTISMYGNPIGRPGKLVIDMNTNKLFASETLAAKSVGASANTMSRHLHGGTDTVMGHIFRLVDTEELDTDSYLGY